VHIKPQDLMFIQPQMIYVYKTTMHYVYIATWILCRTIENNYMYNQKIKQIYYFVYYIIYCCYPICRTCFRTYNVLSFIYYTVVFLPAGHVLELQDSFKGSTTNPSSIALAFYNALWAYDGWYVIITLSILT